MQSFHGLLWLRYSATISLVFGYRNKSIFDCGLFLFLKIGITINGFFTAQKFVISLNISLFVTYDDVMKECFYEFFGNMFYSCHFSREHVHLVVTFLPRFFAENLGDSASANFEWFTSKFEWFT